MACRSDHLESGIGEPLITPVDIVLFLGRVNATLTSEVTTTTDDTIALRELLEKGSDATLLRGSALPRSGCWS